MNSNGSFQINNLTTPTQSGEFYIKASFPGDNLYEKSESNILRFTIIDNNILKENHITVQKNNRKNNIIVNTTSKVFQNYDFIIDEELCFVLMPFNPRFDDIYEKYIKPTLQKNFNKVKRADDIFTSTSIVDDIWKHINKAKLIVADVTGKNPNVFYELGLTHSLSKDFIILTQSENDIPFDIKHIRHVRYSDKEGEWERFQERLQNFVNTILDSE